MRSATRRQRFGNRIGFYRVDSFSRFEKRSLRETYTARKSKGNRIFAQQCRTAAKFQKGIDARYFSLGEVPFVFFENHKTLSKAKLISFGGRMIRFAYNYKGLYHFKNKFNPLWKIVYLGGYPKVKFRHLKLLFTKSRLQDLALYKIKKQIF